MTALEREERVAGVGRGDKIRRKAAPSPGPRAEEERVQTTGTGSRAIMSRPAPEVPGAGAPPMG